MAVNKKIQFLLPVIVFFAGMLPVLYNLGTMGLLESTESLIASVSRYMVDTSNYSTPIYNDIKIFDYAPGVYWITSLGLKIFGNTELGARFFLSVASGITAVCIYFIAKLFFGVQCAVVSSLLLCTSLLFQVSFRVISPAAYCVAFESLLCLTFFHYLNKPSTALRTYFWLILSIGFLFNGFPIFYSIVALTLVALYTGQKEQIKKLYTFGIGIISFVFFGLGWYFVQIIINPGLFVYYLYTLPVNSFIKNYNGLPFYVFLILPLIAVIPWTFIWLEDIKSKIKDFKEDPVVTYLVSWAFLPFFIHLLMTSREYSHFISSLPPLLLLTAPAFQTIYLNKDDKSKKTLQIVKKRRKHNLILSISVALIGMMFFVYGYINYETVVKIAQCFIFAGIFWMFTALIIVAFMLKKLNKSVLVPASILVPSLILFSVPAIQGYEKITKDSFITSKHILLKKISSMPTSDFIFCIEPLYGSYFYTGKKFKLFLMNNNFEFATQESINNIFVNANSIKEKIFQDSYLVVPQKLIGYVSNNLKKRLYISPIYKEESDWVIVSQGESIN